MSRISQCLAQLKEQNKKALVTYIVNGDPYPEATLETMHCLVNSGADIIELGIPFSDPMAEGPVIQRGHERALGHNVSLKSSVELVQKFRQTDTKTPVVLMGYANPVERMGYEKFAELASEAGVDGLLTVDLPPEEVAHAKENLDRVSIDTIFLLAPTTTEKRVQQITKNSSGFVYYVSLKGVTGAGHLNTGEVRDKISMIKSYTDMPILVGFGIKDATSAATIGDCADGVVVGSVLVKAMGEMADQSSAAIAAAVASIVSPMRKALDSLK